MGAAADLAAGLCSRRHKWGWIARCPAHRDRTPSLSIREGKDGRPVVNCFAGCDWSNIRAALQDKRLWPAPGLDRLAPKPRARPRSEKRPQEELLPYLHRLWRDAGPAPGSPVEAYLRGRGIDLALPPILRHARLWHTEAKLRLSCMIAAVQDGRGELTGIHRTFLRPDGCGKAPVEPAKKMLGSCGGGVVRLSPAAVRLVLCEGIETGLSIRAACPELAVWCALSAGNLGGVRIPPVVNEVVIVADGDAVGLRAARRAAERYGATGRRVRLVELPRGMDANDLLRSEAAAA